MNALSHKGPSKDLCRNLYSWVSQICLIMAISSLFGGPMVGGFQSFLIYFLEIQLCFTISRVDLKQSKMVNIAMGTI